MALSPDDIVNKRFQSTKFREGYDQEEVDDFLDEIVVDFRALIKQNEDLKRKLTAAEEEVNRLRQAPAPVAAVSTPAPVAAAPPVQPAVPRDDKLEATSLLALAQKVHDEMVAEAERKRDAMLSEAKLMASRMVEAAEKKHGGRIAQLNRELATLEARVQELRVFERDYRTKLRAYIESNLRELDNKNAA